MARLRNPERGKNSGSMDSMAIMKQVHEVMQAMLEEHKYMLIKIKDVRINETIPYLNISHLDEDIERMKKSVATGSDFVDRYRSAILQLFREEENLSKMFGLAREI